MCQKTQSVSNILAELSITLLLSHCRKLRTFSWYKKFITNLHKVKSSKLMYLGNKCSLTCTLVWPISRVMSRAHIEFHHTVHELRKVKCITDLLTSSFNFDTEKALDNSQLELTSLQRHRELTQTFTFIKFVGKWLSKSKCTILEDVKARHFQHFYPPTLCNSILSKE
jgi:hypothetical protein